jgi:carboxylesterase
MASISTALTAEGYRVITPCIAGHGGTIADLANSSWPEWYESAKNAYNELSRECDSIYLTGMSLGALLGFKLALDEGKNIKALALMSTPVQHMIWNRFFIPLVRYSPLRFAVSSVAKDFQQSVADPEGQRLYREQSLQRLPQEAIFQITDLQKHLREQLRRIYNPLLLIHSRADKVAPYSNVHLIKKLVSSHVVETASFSKSKHVITLDIERELAANAIVQFFKRF